MKKYVIVTILFMAIGLFVSNTVMAQWSTSGSNIYNTNTGNVGIGNGSSWSPSYKLHLQTGTVGASSLMLESDMASGATGYFRILNTTSGNMLNMVLRKSGANWEMLQSVYDAATSTWSEYCYFNFTNHKYQIRSGIADAEFINTGNVLFNNVGGVGVGVTAMPSGAKFAVNGKVNCKEVEVTLTGWSDNVFKPGYSLMPLSEVENFISTNKHLPGVPNEKEVLSKPVNLGEMDALLLKKVEELTLYVLELKKENDQLKKKVENLR